MIKHNLKIKDDKKLETEVVIWNTVFGFAANTNLLFEATIQEKWGEYSMCLLLPDAFGQGTDGRGRK
jgi:hypothetical protein